ncbi:2-hydroxyacid dehydrogenase [Cupriavidus neocaledonicus]|uniref:Glyoxylate reductase GyaR n=1 Tax=Cupriavidus neocaledonicus TaxID=1040979 RepID=A0A375HK56_9BURK|nr:2-hydroxyacid dehydrogenase [Cupriavidus neocaledonicus]SOZ37870.1 Glyoxylate reductase GyaR [Cupriavidus neocaledonicus]SPD58621.1 Glyoxylate reductase GyaR [Cupriavidus neocaledonicus]
MKPTLLILTQVSPHHRDAIAAVFDILYAPDAASRADQLATHGERIRAVLTIGSTGLSAADIDAMPALELVCALGAGFENIAVAHARARGIVVANGAGTNDSCVADHAFALLLATVRAVPQLDAATRAGTWRTALPLRPNVSGKRLGIVGLGTIGRRIARRGEGFDLEIGYHNRTPRGDAGYRYFDNIGALAEWADYLVVATPGGPDTRHLVDARVLAALGPAGFLVNIARGSVVDTEALASALRAGQLGGAGLDVYESEPEPPSILLDCPNVVLTPHVAGWSPEAIAASVAQFLENARRHFAGQQVLTPVA